MSPRRPTPRRRLGGRRLLVAFAAVIAVVLVMPAAALAAGQHGVLGVRLPFGLFGISISGILRSIANDLFKVLAGAFLPSWLKHAPGDSLRWLIALPDPADAVQWPTMHRLEQDTTSVAVAFLPLTLAVAVARYTASGVTGGMHHPAESLGRLVGAAVGLLLFPWAFANAVAAVNVTTATLLGFADVADGLQRALALMFAGGVAFGVSGPLIALLVIAAILLAVGLFIVKVGVLALFAVLFVAGPLTLAGYPIPELHGAWRLWLGLLVAVAMIPIGWCVMFAAAGALSADITHIGTPAAIGTRLVGFFAALLTFVIAFRWPFFLVGMIRSRGLLPTDALGTRTTSSTAAAAVPNVGQRMAQGRAALLAGVTAGGGVVSQFGGALGMPAGGLAAGAGRRAGANAGKLASTPLGLRGRQALASSWRNVRSRATSTTPPSGAVTRRTAAAATVLADAPVTVAAAARASRDHTPAVRGIGEETAAGAGKPPRAGHERRDSSGGDRGRGSRPAGTEPGASRRSASSAPGSRSSSGARSAVDKPRSRGLPRRLWPARASPSQRRSAPV